MRVALFQPEIAGNVGTVIRTAVCWGVPVDLIEPMGFPWGDRALARAGMDYLHGADVTRHVDWQTFADRLQGRLVLLTTRGGTPLPDARFGAEDTLLLGQESAGVPDYVHARADLAVRVPMRAGARSLNVAVTAAVALAEGLRQTGAWPA